MDNDVNLQKHVELHPGLFDEAPVTELDSDDSDSDDDHNRDRISIHAYHNGRCFDATGYRWRIERLGKDAIEHGVHPEEGVCMDAKECVNQKGQPWTKTMKHTNHMKFCRSKDAEAWGTGDVVHAVHKGMCLQV